MGAEAGGQVEGVVLDGADGADGAGAGAVHFHFNHLGEEQEGSGHLAANRVNVSGLLGRTHGSKAGQVLQPWQQGWTGVTAMAARLDL